MSPRTIQLHSKKQSDYAIKLINECLDQDELWCIDIKPYKEAKTLQQLRALFGIWYSYLSETLGYSKDELHQMHKIGFMNEGGSSECGWLLDIYSTEPKGSIQEMWCENYYHLYHDFNGSEFDESKAGKLANHMKRISLSWANIDQMREYMKRIEHYYINAGYPLPILEKFKRWYA